MANGCPDPRCPGPRDTAPRIGGVGTCGLGLVPDDDCPLVPLDGDGPLPRPPVPVDALDAAHQDDDDEGFGDRDPGSP